MKLHAFTREQNISDAIEHLRSEHRQWQMAHRAANHRIGYYSSVAEQAKDPVKRDMAISQREDAYGMMTDLQMDKQDLDLRAKELGITL